MINKRIKCQPLDTTKRIVEIILHYYFSITYSTLKIPLCVNCSLFKNLKENSKKTNICNCITLDDLQCLYRIIAKKQNNKDDIQSICELCNDREEKRVIKTVDKDRFELLKLSMDDSYCKFLDVENFIFFQIAIFYVCTYKKIDNENCLDELIELFFLKKVDPENNKAFKLYKNLCFYYANSQSDVNEEWYDRAVKLISNKVEKHNPKIKNKSSVFDTLSEKILLRTAPTSINQIGS